ncbi:hypothetical protein ACHAXR_009238 [Thalassiosira sp. AJA248-18]
MATKPLVLRFKFNNFNEIPGPSACISQMVKVNNNAWRLKLCQASTEDKKGKEISLFLSLVQGCHVQAKTSFIIRDAVGSAYHHVLDENVDTYAKGEQGIGFDNVMKLTDILDEANNILYDGARIIDVEIQVRPTLSKYRSFDIPLAKNMFKFYANEDCADVSFKVGDELIPAHQLILKMNAPDLAAFCQGCEKGSAIPIEGTSQEVFHIILQYIYGGNAPDPTERVRLGKELIEAANL